jgi:PAS domain S-box-containing protein
VAGIAPLLAGAGWIFDIATLRAVHLSLPAMQPNTVLGLLLAAAGVCATPGPREPRRLSRAVLAIAGTLSFLGGLTLCEYVLGWDAGIDRLLTYATPGSVFPGRPSPQTSANFLMLGAALFCYNLPFLPLRLGQACGLAVGANAIVAATGYIFDARQFYGFPLFANAIGMAVPTAASFVLLALALLCTRPYDGAMSLVISDTRSGEMARRMLLIGIVAPPVVGFFTRVGVLAGWYDVSVQIVLFVLVLGGLMLRTTWRAARRSERDELSVRVTLEQLQVANERLQSTNDERRIFTALVENSSDFIGIADPTGRPVYVNPAGRRMVGLPADYPVEDTRIPDYYASDVRAFASDVIVKSMVEQGFWKGETLFRHWQTQEAIPVSDEHFMIRDTDTGRVLGMGTVTRDISDIRRAEERLRQSEERLELALRGAGLAAWDWNVTTGEVVFSPRWAEMRGFLPQDVKPHVDAWISGVHPEDLPLVQQALDDYFSGRVQEYEVEFRAKTASGGWIWIVDRGEVFARDEGGRPARMVGIERDITRQKRLEEDLRLSQARFSGIIATSADAIVSVDEDQRITMFNQSAEKLFGYDASEVLGAPLDVLMSDGFHDVHRELVRQSAAGEAPERRLGRTTILARRKDGSEFPADAAISKLDVGGATIMTAALRDISEQKRAENEQRFLAELGTVLASTLATEHMLTSVAQLVVRHLADFCVVDAVDDDGGVRRLTAVSRDPDKAPICDALMRASTGDGRPGLLESVLESRRSTLVPRLVPEAIASLTQDDEEVGAFRAMQVRSALAVPVLGRDRPVAAIGLVSCTRSREYGSADLGLAEELARRTGLSMENARLFDETQRAVAIRDEVLAIVSHDLRTPLLLIRLMVNTLHQAKGVDPGARASVDHIERAVDEMEVLIDDLLDFARIQAGTFSVHTSIARLDTVLASVIERMRVLAEARRQTLAVDIPPTLAEVIVDERRIRQVVSNLLHNAIKFTPPGGSVRLSAREGEGDVVVSVIDTGPGIPQESLPHIFDRFWQAPATRQSGVGLGLAIAKGIVEAHGGTIRAASEPSKGSTFVFTLLRADVAARTEGAGRRPARRSR